MKLLKQPLGLTEQVYQALLDEMSAGRLKAGQHLVQEQIAAGLGVSRQPIQQALAMLKNDGLVKELGRRGLFVAPLDLATMRHRYEIRAALDGLAAKLAAGQARTAREVAARIKADGTALIEAGHEAVARGAILDMIECDIAFHQFICAASGNPLIAETAQLQWRQLRRVMGEVLRSDAPMTIWREHQDILAAVVSGDAIRAEAAAVAHVWTAAERLERALGAAQPTSMAS